MQARVMAHVRGQPAGQRGGQPKPASKNEPLPVPNSARVVFGRRHHRLRILVDHQMCRDGKKKQTRSENEEMLGTGAARRSHSTTLGKCLKSAMDPARSTLSKTSKSTVPELRIRTIALSCDFNIAMVSQLLAAGMDSWPSSSLFGSSKNCRGIILMWQCSPSFCG